MISLKKCVEQHREELLASSLSSYKSAVTAMASSGARACPSLAGGLQQALMTLAERVVAASDPGELAATGRQIERELDGWGGQASDYYHRKAGEIREIILAMTEAARSVAERDERYKAQFGEVSARLQTAGDLEDLTQIRQLINQSAGELRACVDRMVEDGRESVSRLKAQVASYEERLAEAERASSTDSLTGLLNRAAAERDIAARIRAGRSFCMLMADLNGFKALNDRLGHAAGDELLAAFAGEFRAQFRPLDTVSRWGGDEFVVLIDGAPADAQARLEQVRRWAFGEYTLGSGTAKQKLQVSASLGLAFWQPGKTAEQLFVEADRAMYADKSKFKRS